MNLNVCLPLDDDVSESAEANTMMVRASMVHLIWISSVVGLSCNGVSERISRQTRVQKTGHRCFGDGGNFGLGQAWTG